jgi:hypothetical protein
MKTKVTALTIFATLLAATAGATGLSSAAAVAMGGAHIGLARGVYAPRFNPANIGLSEYREAGLELAGAGAQIINNSFTLKEYNEYTGALLTEEDKSAILGKIPAEGLKISAEAEAATMTLSLSSFVLSITGSAATEVNLGKDALELFLRGNGLNESFSMEGMYSEAVAYASIGLSYGRAIYKSGTRQLAVGATFKYIKGLAYEKVIELTGGVITLATGFEGEGTMTAQTATGGNGLGVDIGAALKINDDYTAGITFANLLNTISWNNKTEEHYYHFEFDTLTIDNMNNDSIVVSDDYSRDIPGFSSTLPVVMKIGIANTSGKLIWAIDWAQGFKLAAGSSSKPRLSAGVEYRPFDCLPLRTGYSLGGGKGSSISFGTGVDLDLFYLDLAATNHSSLNFSSTKGLHFAISTGFRF